MSLRRVLLVARADFAFQARRPLIWILVVIMALTVWGLSTGNVRIESGDASVGGVKAWVNSEFAIAEVLSVTVFLFYSFFVAVAAGMAVIDDEDRKIGEILHATPLTAREYILGKTLSILLAFTAVLAIQQLVAIVAYQWLPNKKADEIRGPFHLAAYVVPALVFGLPSIVFTALTSLAVGVRWRRPILVFVLPVALLLGCGFFLWNWSPTWLSLEWNRVLMALDPAGFRWLNETHLKLDRGVAFYNTHAIPFDMVFWASRAAILAIGLLSLWGAARHFEKAMRGETKASKREGRAHAAAVAESTFVPLRSTQPLARLVMQSAPPRFFAGAWRVARIELKELKSAPGLYLFVPLILIQTIGSCLTALGPFGTLLLATPGTLAVRMMNTLTLLVCLMLLFYTVESHERERKTGLAPIFDATPVATASVLFGKSLANAVIGAAVLVACFIGSAIVILVQAQVPLRLGPFVLTWGVLQFPTFLVWSCFVTAAIAIARNRYAAYAIGLAAMSLTGYLQVKDKMNWVFNWDLWGAVQWSDMSVFEMSRRALVENRVLVLLMSALFVVVAVRFHTRREVDAVRVLHRLRPAALGGTVLRLSPWAAAPAILAIVLGYQVGRGHESDAAKKIEHDYWKQNLATWKDVPQPEIVDVVVDLDLDPANSAFKTKGTFRLANPHDAPLRQFALTGGPHWGEVKWTLDGKDVKPENRTHLFVFTPESPMSPGGAVTVGFAFDGIYPKGISKNGGGQMEFIVPSGVVLTSFTPSFVPIVGYEESVGVEEEKNKYETKVYPDDFYVGKTDPAFGSGSAFTAKVTITGPAEFGYNSVGVLESDTVKDGRRTCVWTTDTKVRFLNVVAGKWAVRRGNGVAVYYHPEHTYNLDEIVAALEGARTWYSQWFREFPWKELKLSEFPALSGYAQGFATDITFSESIGFLTRQEKSGNAPFTVTAHEAAHQWWGNMLLPGKGPGGDLLSEGMAHFSTILLIDKVKGPSDRIEFCKRIEESYGDDRQVDSEKPMVKVDGSKPGDTTVTYDKMGWVVWMLLQQMGRDNLLRGLHDFQRDWDQNPDHPVLQDFTAYLRPYAPDPAAYDAFVEQWFHKVVVPEYTLSDAKKTKAGEGWTATVNVTNKGTGTMPLAVAAANTSDDRFDKKGKPKADYEDARETITLGAGESKTVTIACPFEPKVVLVDPDAVVLQLNRKKAVAKL